MLLSGRVITKPEFDGLSSFYKERGNFCYYCHYGCNNAATVTATAAVISRAHE